MTDQSNRPDIDWNSDEAVVCAAFGANETRSNFLGDYSYDGHSVITRTVPAEDDVFGEVGDWIELGKSLLQDEEAAWAEARKHPAVVAFDKANRPVPRPGDPDWVGTLKTSDYRELYPDDACGSYKTAAVEAQREPRVPEVHRDKAGDWPEDFSHENGEYENSCRQCGRIFVGHKRRPWCKLCSDTPESPILPTDPFPIAWMNGNRTLSEEGVKMMQNSETFGAAPTGESMLMPTDPSKPVTMAEVQIHLAETCEGEREKADTQNASNEYAGLLERAKGGHWEAYFYNSWRSSDNYQWGSFPAKEEAVSEAKRQYDKESSPDTTLEFGARYVFDNDGEDLLALLNQLTAKESHNG